MLDWISPIDGALAGALVVSALAAGATGRRGGRFRALPGWVGFWAVLSGILICLSHAHPALSLPLLGLLMFAGLRTYFFVAPMRPRDRYAILAAYLSIPVALYPGFTGSSESFVATVPIALFLLLPVLLSIGPVQEGFLDSAGRILLGVLIFVFCAAHLALLVRSEHSGLLELYGVLVLASELPQRLAGRPSSGTGRGRVAGGVAVSLLLATALAFWLGPSCGLVEEDAARAGVLVAIAVTLGALVGEAVAKDLAMGPSATRVGWGAFLDRAIPAVYAAPVYFHYLNHFA